MATYHLLRSLSVLQVALCLTIVALTFYRRIVSVFPALVAFVMVVGSGESVRTSILFYRRILNIPKESAYLVLFVSDWAVQLLELGLLVAIIYGLFSEAMRPFPGLQRIGQIVFRWVGAVSLLVAIALSAGPELFVKGRSLFGLYTEIAPRFQQGINVLILCLLIFVCFAIRPLGLTFRSHIFGIVLGLGVFSTAQLVQAAWLAIRGGHDLYSPVYILGAAGGCIACLVWGTYFGLPEPKRRMILLPTTSPFFLWNRISEILGDAPGSVAIAGFSPEMLAPAEVEMLTLAISREEASAQERESVFLDPALPSAPGSLYPAALPAPSERDFVLSR